MVNAGREKAESTEAETSKHWTALYASCVHLPEDFTTTTSSPDASRAHLTNPSSSADPPTGGGGGSSNTKPPRIKTEYVSPFDTCSGTESGGGDAAVDVDMDVVRASTLDFGRGLEEGERRERERCLGLGGGGR